MYRETYVYVNECIGSSSYRFNAVQSKQFECAMLLICYIASLKGGDKSKEEARIFLFFLLSCGDAFKYDKICLSRLNKIKQNAEPNPIEHAIKRRRFAFYSFG